MIYGDELLPTKPTEALLTGKFNHVDLLFGNCNNEGAGSVHSFVKITTPTLQEVHDALQHHFQKEVADFYTANLPAQPTADQLLEVTSKALGDERFDCPTTLMAENMAKFSPNQRFYAYRLMQPIHPEPVAWKAVPHAGDVGYIFSATLPETNVLSKDMVHAWTTFVKTGHPSKMGTTEWALAFTDHTKPATQFMALNSSDYKMVKDYYVKTCTALWKPILYHP